MWVHEGTSDPEFEHVIISLCIIIISNVYESLVGPIKGIKFGNKARVAQALKLTTLRSGNWDEIRNKGVEPQ